MTDRQLSIAFVAGTILGVAALAHALIASQPMKQFTIDTTQWSCSTTDDGRMVSCIKHSGR